MTVIGKRGVELMMVMVMMVMVIGSSEHGGSNPTEKPDCQQMRGECRVKTEYYHGYVARNVSCYCKQDKEVSYHLRNLVSLNCMNAASDFINVSTLHIVGCSVTDNTALQSMLVALRGSSEELQLYISNAGYISFPSRLNLPGPSSSRAPLAIRATFRNSDLSGLPEGVGSGAVGNADILVEDSKVGVLETRAFSNYGPNATVVITLRNSRVQTVQQGAFDLPRGGHVTVSGGEILSMESNSYIGGGQLILDSVKIAKLLGSAISIYGLEHLNVTNCTMASVYYHALDQRPPSYVRNITWGRKPEGEAIFSDNKFLGGSGQAFAELCSVAKITWQNNTLLTKTGMPFLLQDPECGTQRNWARVFSSNRIRCESCTDFGHTDEQTCAFFSSSYCISCEKDMDNCNQPVLPYMISKCRAYDADISKALNDTCSSHRIPKALEAIGNEPSGASLPPLALTVSMCVLVLFCVSV